MIKPKHYQGLEPITFIQAHHMLFEEGCVIKYVTRQMYKDDIQNRIEDLEKAKTYIDFIISRLEESCCGDGGNLQ